MKCQIMSKYRQKQSEQNQINNREYIIQYQPEMKVNTNFQKFTKRSQKSVPA